MVKRLLASVGATVALAALLAWVLASLAFMKATQP